MKHYIAETHLPKDGPLRRYIGVDAETSKEARKKFAELLEEGEWLCNVQSLQTDKINLRKY